MRQDQWTCKELDILRREFPKRTNEEMTKLIKRNQKAIEQKAHKLGLKKERYGTDWTPQMIKTLRDFFPSMFNKPLAKWLGVSQRTMIRKARELGLEKREGFLENRRADISRMAGDALRARGDREGTWFKKGQHVNPDGEFKKGHRESEATKAKRSASLKATFKRKKEMKRLGLQ